MRNRSELQTTRAELMSRTGRLQLLYALTHGITSNLQLAEFLSYSAAGIHTLMKPDTIAIGVPEPGSMNVRVYTHVCRSKDVPNDESEFISLCDSCVQQAFDNLKPVIVDDPGSTEPGRVLRELGPAQAFQSIYLFPLVTGGRALGLLMIGHIKQTPLRTEEIEFLSLVASQLAIAVENAIALRELSELKQKLAEEQLCVDQEFVTEPNFEHIIGCSSALKHVLRLVETVAPNDSTVLLLGETGTGKELIARAIHERSRRRERVFAKLNCAAIPTGLLESELFGHEKGAFTGAISQKAGRMELADHGTLFLDEVGDIPIEIQPKLLRALQEREFERLGSNYTRKVNVRLIAATNRDLKSMIASREFRSDLYYRLNVFPIRIPPLRERKEDIPLLVRYFVQKFSKQMQKKIDIIPTAVMSGLREWDWPGNIRELENFLERAVILTRGRSLEAPLGELRRSASEPPEPAWTGPADFVEVIKRTLHALDRKRNTADERAKHRRDEIVRALTETKGRVGGSDGAAARLGLNRTTLLSRIKRLRIEPEHYA